MSNTYNKRENEEFEPKHELLREASANVLEGLPREFREFATEIEHISGSWNVVEIFTPDPSCVEKEQNAFLQAVAKGEAYTPVFTYSIAEQMDVADGRAKLEALLTRVLEWEPKSKVETLSRRMLRAKVMDDLMTCDLVDGIRMKDDRLVRAAMNQKYLPVDASLLQFEEAKFLAAITYREKAGGDYISLSHFTEEEATYLRNMHLNTAEQKAFFEWALHPYGLLRTNETEVGFCVVVDPKTQTLDVRHRSSIGQVISIPENPISRKPFTIEDAVILLDHEIEAHALQTANGQVMFGLRGAMTLDDETWYEGLAMRRETNAYKQHFGQEDHAPRFYAHAIRSAEEGKDFYGIFNDLYRMHLHVLLKLPMDALLPQDPDPVHVTEARRIAWTTTYRVMRGHTDMSNTHAFAMRKDLAYGRGFALDRNLVAAGKEHLNEIAVIADGGMELLEELGVTPDDIVYKYKNLTADLVRSLKESFARKAVFDMQEFVREQSRKMLGKIESL